MSTSQAIQAGLPTTKTLEFHSSETRVTVHVPVSVEEYFTMSDSCTLVFKPAAGIELDTMKSVILDSDRVMNPFGIGERYSKILNYKDDMFEDGRKLVVEFAR